MSNLIITISRDVGSGGHEIGNLLAQELGIPCYDRQLIELIAQKSGLSPEFIDKSEEGINTSYFFTVNPQDFVHSTLIPQYNVVDQMFTAQAEAITELAQKESCIFIGRCANYVLKYHANCINVFIHANRADRLKRIINEYDGINQDNAEKMLDKLSRGRAKYYSYFTGEKMGNARDFHLTLNSSVTGIKGAVELIKALLKYRIPT